MLEGVASQRSVVHLDVHLEVLVKSVSAEEAAYGLGVHVVLVLGRLHGLRLDEECALESLAASIVAGHSQHRSHMFLLTLLIGVEQAHVALTSAPEHIVLTAELNGSVDGILYLNDSAGYDVEVGVSRSTVHIALVAEDISRSPEILDVGVLLHLLQSVVGDCLHASLILLNGGSLLNEVYIVEAEVLDTQLIHNLETSVHLVLSALNGVICLVPLVAAGLSAKRISTGLSKYVPPSHSELQPVLHLLSHHDLFGLVIVESHYILTVLSLERNFTGKRKILFCHNFLN